MASERKSYSLKFKFDALKRLDESDGNISAVAREFNVGRQQIRYWNKQRATIINAKGDRFLDSRKILRVRNGIAKYPLLDTEMVNMIKKRRKENKSVTQKMIQNEARRKFPELYLYEEPFLASEG